MLLMLLSMRMLLLLLLLLPLLLLLLFMRMLLLLCMRMLLLLLLRLLLLRRLALCCTCGSAAARSVPANSLPTARGSGRPLNMPPTAQHATDCSVAFSFKVA